MRQVFIGLFLLWSTTLYGADFFPPPADFFPPPFTAKYKLYAKGFSAGEGTRTLGFRRDGKLQFESFAKTTGFLSWFKKIELTERTVFTREGGKIRPVEYTYRQTGSKARTSKVSFDWVKKEAKNTFKGQTEYVKLLKEGILDKLLYQVVLMQELKEGKRQLKYKVVDKGKISVYAPKFIGKADVDTGMGKLETLKYQQVSSSKKKRRTTLWCAPSLHYLPVQIEHVDTSGDVFRMVLQSLVGLK